MWLALFSLAKWLAVGFIRVELLCLDCLRADCFLAFVFSSVAESEKEKLKFKRITVVAIHSCFRHAICGFRNLGCQLRGQIGKFVKTVVCTSAIGTAAISCSRSIW